MDEKRSHGLTRPSRTPRLEATPDTRGSLQLPKSTSRLYYRGEVNFSHSKIVKLQRPASKLGPTHQNEESVRQGQNHPNWHTVSDTLCQNSSPAANPMRNPIRFSWPLFVICFCPQSFPERERPPVLGETRETNECWESPSKARHHLLKRFTPGLLRRSRDRVMPKHPVNRRCCGKQ